ncbi:MAG: UDP-diphosphatase [Trueperaceae bacterium]|nr:UDP-diphosphatase [Trueperaceae bacterium]
MSSLQAIILGFVQGLTEFLPISSSGHLVLVNYYLGWGKSLPLHVDIATNTGTLLAVIVFLRRDVYFAVTGFFSGLKSPRGRTQEGWALAIRVLLASIPTIFLGLGLREVFEQLNSPIPVSFALIITGLFLWFAPCSGSKTKVGNLTIFDVVFTGVAQGLAVIPGISRSGITISALLSRGASNELAPRFSFMMYLVISLGVAVLGLFDLPKEIRLGSLTLMTLTSFVTGYIALYCLFAVLRRGKFRWFAPYLWLLATFTLLWNFLS